MSSEFQEDYRGLMGCTDVFWKAFIPEVRVYDS